MKNPLTCYSLGLARKKETSDSRCSAHHLRLLCLRLRPATKLRESTTRRLASLRHWHWDLQRDTFQIRRPPYLRYILQFHKAVRSQSLQPDHRSLAAITDATPNRRGIRLSGPYIVHEQVMNLIFRSFCGNQLLPNIGKKVFAGAFADRRKLSGRHQLALRLGPAAAPAAHDVGTTRCLRP